MSTEKTAKPSSVASGPQALPRFSPVTLSTWLLIGDAGEKLKMEIGPEIDPWATPSRLR